MSSKHKTKTENVQKQGQPHKRAKVALEDNKSAKNGLFGPKCGKNLGFWPEAHAFGPRTGFWP